MRLNSAIRGTTVSFLVGLLTGVFFVPGGLAQEKPARLELADRIRLIEEGDGSDRPFFRVQINVVSEQGLPVSIARPKDSASAFEIVERGGATHRPLSLRYHQEALSEVPSGIPNQRYALLLIDISGSMLDSSNEVSGKTLNKYEAATTAARSFLKGFQAGQDHVAVVSFESHQVRERIKAAAFASDIASAERQIADLPLPQKQYNTALYSAVDTALDVLVDLKRQNPAAGTLLLVLTDGQNQVLKGDDADLLVGAEGLEAVVDKANTAGVQIMTIGFGDESTSLGKKGAIDSEALRRLAWPTASHFRTAQDVQSLGKLFGVARELLVNRWQITFATHRQDRSQLAGLDLQFLIRLRLDDRFLESPWVFFKTPQMSAPPFEGRLDAGERQALSQVSAAQPVQHSPSIIASAALRRSLIFLLFGGLLGLFWFVVPLILWPRQAVRLSNPPALSAAQASSKVASPSASAAATPSERSVQEPSKTEILLHPPPPDSPDRTLYDPRGQETVLLGLARSTTGMASKTEIRLAPDLDKPVPPLPGPDSTLILNRLPDQPEPPGQTQIQFASVPRKNAPDRTVFDPRAQETVVLKPDETVIDPRGEQTLILPPQEEPPTKR